MDACKCLNWENTGYLPHLSLAYGNYSNDKKENMKSSMKIIPGGFLVDHIFLAYNDEINLKWKVIQEFKLGG